MARKSKTGGGDQKIQGSQTMNSVRKGGPQSGDAKKVKNINVIQGIIPLEVNQLSNPATPQGGNRRNTEIQVSNRASWADLVEEETMATKTAGSTKTIKSTTKSWSSVMGSILKEEGFDLTEESTEMNVKITMADIKDEVEYWITMVVCYILGSNPLQVVMDGYFRRIWGSLGIDKVAQLNRGVFVVQFHSVESRSKVVEEGVQMFDRKLVIVKP